MSTIPAGTEIVYTFVNEFGKTVTRPGVLTSDAQIAPGSGAADLVYFHNPSDDSVTPNNGTEVEVPQAISAVVQSSLPHWAVAASPPYAATGTGPTGPRGPTGPTGANGATGPTGA
jgi:hypothetical protein